MRLNKHLMQIVDWSVKLNLENLYNLVGDYDF